MRQEAALTAKQLQGLRHEASHTLVVTMLKERFEQLKNQLVEASEGEWKNLQGRAQECRTLLRKMTGEHSSKLA